VSPRYLLTLFSAVVATVTLSAQRGGGLTGAQEPAIDGNDDCRRKSTSCESTSGRKARRLTRSDRRDEKGADRPGFLRPAKMVNAASAGRTP
jgi:hypothetical protein